MLEKSEADLWAWFRDGMHKELHDLEKRRHRIQARATSWILAVAALTMLAYVAPVLLHLPRPVFVPLGGLLVLAAFFKDDSVVELVLGGIGLMLWSIWPQQPMDEFFRLTLPFLYRVLPEGTLYPAVAVALVGVFDIHHRMRDFTSDFKSRVIRVLAQFIDPNWQFIPNSFVAKRDFQDSGIFPDVPVDFSGEDLVTGSVGQTSFEMSEVRALHLQSFTDVNGVKRSRRSSLFRGFMFVCNYNRHFPHEVFVFPDTAERFLGFMGTRLQEMNRSHGELVKLEDPVFEKYFAVYGSDQIATRMVLPPSIMEEMVAFREKSGTPVSMSIRQGRFFAAVPLTRNLFEPPLFRPITRFSELRELFDDLTLFIDLARAIDLNTRRWSETSGLSELG